MKTVKSICGKCGSDDITKHTDIGHDVGAGDDYAFEETQHIEKCNKCDAWRFVCEGVKYGKTCEEYTKHGKWLERDLVIEEM